ncbi:MAG: hypothetical protein VX619_00425 [bacterium]|nr:hypothetical protein [bacterium]
MYSERNDLIAVIIANQSWVNIDNQVDYALLDLDSEGECWTRKLIRKIVEWNFFDRVIVLHEDESFNVAYSKICSEQGVDFRLVPKELYKWPRIWYPWAWNLENRDKAEIILAWVYWLQEALNPATYFVLNITGGFVRKEHMSKALDSYKSGHRAALQNDFGRCGYLVDSTYLNTVYSTNYKNMALLADFEDHQHLEQTISDHGPRIEAFQSRLKMPMGLWSKRYFDFLQKYCNKYPEEALTLELNSKMLHFFERNYFLHQSKWLNFLEIILTGDHSNWLSCDHLIEICRQAERYGRVTIILNFHNNSCSEELLNLIDAVSRNLFLAVKISAESPNLLIKSLFNRVDYLELGLPENIDYLNYEYFESKLFYQNWVSAYEQFSRNQKPCLGIRVNIPKDSRQSIAMLEYFKDKVDFNPCMVSERVQGDGYPRTPNLKFENHLSYSFEESFKSQLGGLCLNHQGQGIGSKTVYEMPIEQQLRLSNLDRISVGQD